MVNAKKTHKTIILFEMFDERNILLQINGVNFKQSFYK